MVRIFLSPTFFSVFILRLFATSFFLYLASCTGGTFKVVDTLQKGSDSQIYLKIDGNPATAEINEGSSVLLLISQTKARKTPTPVTLTITSTRGDIAEVFPTATLISANQAKFDFTIEANQSYANLNITAHHNSAYSGNRFFSLAFSTSDKEVINELPAIQLNVKDLESPPVISFASSSQNANENSGSKSVEVTLIPAATTEISLPYIIQDGTATQNSDYTASNGTLTFSPGQTSKTISFSLIDDSAVENGLAETFTINLGAIAGVGSVTTGTHTVNIIDDDTESFSIAAASANEGSSVVFTVSLSNVSPNTLTVDYATSDGTANSPSNYTSKSGTLTFSPGQTSKTISVATVVNASEVCANPRTFTMTLSNPVGASVSVSSALGTINDPDLPSLSISDANATEGFALSISVSLSAACNNKTVSFNFASATGTAVSDVDFTAVNNSGSITAGNTTSSISVNTLQDSNYEGNETLTVALSSLSNATAGTSSATGTINDDEVAQGSFSISGITGLDDSTVDAYLNGTLSPIITWGSSTNSTSYDVTVFENDGTTVKCSTQNTLSTTITFGEACNLSAGTFYKAKVIAKVGLQTLDASNNLYSFYTNRNPVLGSGGSGPWHVLAGSSITINAQWAASPSVGVATDPDSDTLSFSSTNNGNLGAVTNSSTTLSYAASATSFGSDTFSVTISDGKGGTLTQNITVYVMTPFTWTGAISTSWGAPGNWCGTIASNKKSCSGSPAAPGVSDTIVFDSTCSSPFTCSPTTTSNLTVNGVRISANGFTQGAGFTFSLGSSIYSTHNEWKQSGGTFNGGNSGLSLVSPVTLSGGTFKLSSGTSTIWKSFTISGSGSLDHNSGTLIVRNDGNPTLTMGNVTFNNLEIANGSSWTGSTFSGTFDILGFLTFQDSGYGTNVSGGTFNVFGNVTHNGSGNIRGFANSNTIRLVGGSGSAATLTGVGGGYFGNLEIASAGTVTFATTGSVDIRGNYTYTSGTLVTTNSTIKFVEGSAQTITPGSQSYHHVVFSKNSTSPDTLVGTLKVNGNLVLNGYSYWPSINGGTIEAKGDVSVTGGSFGPGTTSLKMVGDAGSSVTLTDDGGTSSLPNLEIASAGTVTMSSTNPIEFGRGLIYTSGTVNTTGSTLSFISGSAISITPGNINYNNITINKATPGSNTLVGTWNILGNLSLGGSNYWPTIDGGNILVKGNLSVSGAWAGGSTSITLNGDGAQSISQSGGKFPGSTVTINNASSAVTLGSAVNFNYGTQNLALTAGSINLGSYPLTIAGTLSLNGNNLTKNGQTLMVGGSTVGTGSLFGGTINP